MKKNLFVITGMLLLLGVACSAQSQTDPAPQADSQQNSALNVQTAPSNGDGQGETNMAPDQGNAQSMGTKGEETTENATGTQEPGEQSSAQNVQPIPQKPTADMTKEGTDEHMMDYPVEMTSTNFSFKPNTLTAKVGVPVELKITNSGFHNFVIGELGVNQQLAEGLNTVSFTPTKEGTFIYYCSVGSHRAMGMWGTLTVTK